MRNEETHTTPVINPEHEAIVQTCFDRAVAGEELGGDRLNDLFDTQTYARQIDDKTDLFVDIATDGRFQAWLEDA